MDQKDIRKRVRMLKAMQNISYKELSGYLEIKESSMYNWLRGQYELSYNKAKLLEEVVATLED